MEVQQKLYHISVQMSSWATVLAGKKIKYEQAWLISQKWNKNKTKTLSFQEVQKKRESKEKNDKNPKQ